MLNSSIIFLILSGILFDNALSQSSSYASSSASSYASATSYVIPRKPDKCPIACAAIYDPVCATNGRCYKTFSSKCHIDSENCNSSDKFMFVSNGECENQPLKTPLCGCSTICTMDYRPICASNGKCFSTFGNQCALDGYNRCYPNDYFWKIYEGECSTLSDYMCY